MPSATSLSRGDGSSREADHIRVSIRSPNEHGLVGLASVLEPDGDETEVRASLRIEPDEWSGGSLIGPADWRAIASSTEPLFELRLPDGRSECASCARSIRSRCESGAPMAEPTRTDELRERKTT